MASGGGTSITSDEITDHYCSVCKSGGKNVEAVTYCADCPDYYCGTCVDIHTTVPALRGHKLVTEDEDGKLPSCPTLRCERHRSKVIDMYCRNHGQVGCSTCISADHRTCEGVFDIAGFIETNSFILSEAIDSLKDIQSRIQGLLNLFRLEQGHLQRNKNAVVDEINTMRAKLERTIRKAAEDAIQKVNDEFNVLSSELKDKIDTLKGTVEQVNKRCSEIQSNSGNEPQAFVLLKNGEGCISEAKRINDEMNQIVLGRKLSFTPSSMYEKILTSTDSCLGNVALVPPHVNSFIFSNIDFDVKLLMNKVETIIIEDLCTTNDSVIVAEVCYGMLLRVCPSKVKITEYLRLPLKSRHVCTVSDKVIAVSLNKTIRLYRIGNKIEFLRDISIGVCSTGLCCHDIILYVACKDALYKYDMNGVLLKSYKPITDGNNVFTGIGKFVINPLNAYIHLTDHENGVITIDQEGSVVNVVKDVIIEPGGICADKFGLVYVSEPCSNSIIQLSSVGAYITRNMVKCPGALCFHEGTDRLFVSTREEFENTITAIDVY